MKCEFVPNYFYVPWTYINQNPQPKKLGQKVNDYPKICRIPSQLMEMVMYFSLCISSLLNMYALQTNKLSLDLKILVYLLYDYERALQHYRLHTPKSFRIVWLKVKFKDN